MNMKFITISVVMPRSTLTIAHDFFILSSVQRFPKGLSAEKKEQRDEDKQMKQS